ATRRRCSTGCSGCSRSASATRCSASAASRCCRPRTRRCWPTCASGRATWCSASTIFPASPSPSSFRCSALRVGLRSSCSGGFPSRASGSFRTSSPWVRTGSTGSRSWRRPFNEGFGMISPTALAPHLAEYLPRQRWFGAKDRTVELVRIREAELLTAERAWPALLRVDAEVSLAGDGEGQPRYQVLLGLRPTGVACEFLAGHEPAVLGEFETAQGQALAYDALLDSELALQLLRVMAPGFPAERVRPLGAEQSNTSLVYDDAMILKVFRRLTEGHNPEVEVIETLAACG